ncbi:LAQU0S24e00298g1_1 [Lachancea quebecensis]|uniref:LAQU0S24e00298g1_1 n=1 Tax=Lachancea quebecensis TaxID=1654605 RepID=A0A0P1L6I1_9SACH|nr:LAQU0S24e00298g1_1 [Lachancea quebecensis]
MKLIKDLPVVRKELADWTENLTWAHDGTLYLTTVPDITVCAPVYNEVINSSKDLFHIKEYPLPLVNKFEYELAQKNVMINSVPESFIKICQASPVSGLLAVLTNNANACVYNGQRLVAQLDQPERTLEERAYHSLAWNVEGNMIAIGNEACEVILFSVHEDFEDAKFTHHHTIKLNSAATDWVTKIEWYEEGIIISLSNNSVHLVRKDDGPKQIKCPSRFKTSDLKGIENNVIITSVGCVHRYDTKSGDMTSLSLGGCDNFYVVPLPDHKTALLISNKTSCLLSLGQELRLQNDVTISPHIETKFKKWNNYFNELNNYETNFLIHGLATSPDGACLALVYSIDRLSIRYRIVSEQQYRISFFPLGKCWEIKQGSTGLAWYQNYQIYNKQLPHNFETYEGRLNLDTTLCFTSYLQELMNNKRMNNLRFSNFVEQEKDNNLYKRAVYDYAVAHKGEVANALDKACVQSIADLLALESPITPEIYIMKGEFIDETFSFHASSNADTVQSEEGHNWKRCRATFLPLITSKVKVCPVSNYRIIDIKQDALNDYGWLTQTILQFFNNQSIYSGTRML